RATPPAAAALSPPAPEPRAPAPPDPRAAPDPAPPAPVLAPDPTAASPPASPPWMGLHAPLEHQLPAEQSEAPLQLVLHPLAAHAYGPQSVVVGTVQAP